MLGAGIKVSIHLSIDRLIESRRQLSLNLSGSKQLGRWTPALKADDYRLNMLFVTVNPASLKVCHFLKFSARLIRSSVVLTPYFRRVPYRLRPGREAREGHFLAFPPGGAGPGALEAVSVFRPNCSSQGGGGSGDNLPQLLMAAETLSTLRCHGADAAGLKVDLKSWSIFAILDREFLFKVRAQSSSAFFIGLRSRIRRIRFFRS